MHPLVTRVTEWHDVRIDRQTKWGNPYPLERFDSREECVAAFDEYFMKSELKKDLHELTGKRLGCHCAPALCHGDTLARMANNPFTIKAYCHEK